MFNQELHHNHNISNQNKISQFSKNIILFWTVVIKYKESYFRSSIMESTGTPVQSHSHTCSIENGSGSTFVYGNSCLCNTMCSLITVYVHNQRQIFDVCQQCHMSRITIILIHHLTGVRVRYTLPLHIAVAIHCPASLRLQPPLSGLSKHFYQLLKQLFNIHYKTVDFFVE